MYRRVTDNATSPKHFNRYSSAPHVRRAWHHLEGCVSAVLDAFWMNAVVIRSAMLPARDPNPDEVCHAAFSTGPRIQPNHRMSDSVQLGSLEYSRESAEPPRHAGRWFGMTQIFIALQHCPRIRRTHSCSCVFVNRWHPRRLASVSSAPCAPRSTAAASAAWPWWWLYRRRHHRHHRRRQPCS